MKITEHVHAIKIPFKVTNDLGMIMERFVYTYLILGDEICLIDSGVVSSEDIIYNYVENIGIKPEDISIMVLTHSHPDHIGSAPSIRGRSGCIVAANFSEKAWIEDIELQFRERPVPNFHSLVEGPVHVNKFLNDGDLIDLGRNVVLKVIHTPGHSKGSISLHLPVENLLITGDAIPLKGDLPIYEDVKSSVQSIKRLNEIKGLQILLTSWDDPRKGEDVYTVMEEGYRYLKKVHETVIETSQNKDVDPFEDSHEFTKMVLGKLCLPEAAANPVIMQSFRSNLDAIDFSFD